jgi:hypothetical protein
MSDTATDASAAAKVRRRRRGRLGLLQAVWVMLVLSVAAIAVLSLTGMPVRLPAWATDRIEAAVNARIGGARLDIGRVELRFGADGRPEAQLGNVAIRDGAGNPVAQLNALGADFSAAALIGGRLQPRVVELSGAQVTLRRDGMGGISVSFGGVGQGAATPGEAVAMIDRFFFAGPMAGIARIEAADITITLEDARSGRVWQATGGSVEIVNGADRLDVTIRSEVFNGTEDLAEVEIIYAAERGRPAATLTARFVDAAAEDIARRAPRSPFSGSSTRGSRAPCASTSTGGAALAPRGLARHRRGAAPPGAGGAALRVRGRARRGGLRSRRGPGGRHRDRRADRTRLARRRGAAPARRSLGRLAAGGLRAGPRKPGSTLRRGRSSPRPLSFDEAFADLRVALDPFALDIGQLTLQGPHGRQDITGRVGASPDGWRIALDVAGAETTIADALALWPVPIARGAREWVAENVLSAQARDYTIAIRAEPGQRPVTGMSFAFEDAEVRVMRDLPPVTGAAGTATLTGPRFALALSEGRMVDETGGVADLAGSTFVVPDGAQIPRRAEVDIAASAPLQAVLRILDNPPFRVLGRSAQPDALLAARAEAISARA